MGSKKIRFKCKTCGKKRKVRGPFQSRTNTQVKTATCELCEGWSWCPVCVCATKPCPVACGGTTCNAGGCDVCKEPIGELIKLYTEQPAWFVQMSNKLREDFKAKHGTDSMTPFGEPRGPM